MTRPLTPKQARFVEEYLVDLNATQAAIRAGYSQKTAAQVGWENLRKPQIARAVVQAKAERSLRTGITQDQVVERLRQLAWAEVTRAASWDTYGLELVDSSELEPPEAAAIRSVEMGPHGPKIKFGDPVPALRLLGQHVGAFEAEKQAGDQLVEVNIVVDPKRDVKRKEAPE